jgi:hypothetical protein
MMKTQAGTRIVSSCRQFPPYPSPWKSGTAFAKGFKKIGGLPLNAEASGALAITRAAFIPGRSSLTTVHGISMAAPRNAKAARIFSLSRIRNIALLDEQYTLPKNWDYRNHTDGSFLSAVPVSAGQPGEPLKWRCLCFIHRLGVFGIFPCIICLSFICNLRLKQAPAGYLVENGGKTQRERQLPPAITADSL